MLASSPASLTVLSAHWCRDMPVMRSPTPRFQSSPASSTVLSAYWWRVTSVTVTLSPSWVPSAAVGLPEVVVGLCCAPLDRPAVSWVPTPSSSPVLPAGRAVIWLLAAATTADWSPQHDGERAAAGSEEAVGF